MATDFISARATRGGVFYGTTLIQSSGVLGGSRHVFVKLIKGGKDGLVYPTHGGKLLNPFKGGHAKIYAGDLIEYDAGLSGDAGSTVKILKSYEVLSATGTTVNIVRDGYRHIPFAGDNIMKAPDTLDGTGTAVTVTAVKKTAVDGTDVWQLTVSAALTAEKGDVLVEAAAAGDDVKAMVTNPNAYAPCDADFIYEPNEAEDDIDGAIYMLTPCLANCDTVLYEKKMSPVPPAVKALNRSRVAGWFWFD